jgi:transcription elongation factor GreA
MKKVPITKVGFEKIKRELEHLKTVAVPENVRDIEAARAHGDISENAEYTAAKERQAFIHGKIQELENNLATSEIIDLKNLSTDRIVFGTSVIIEDVKKGKNITYQLVGPHESDIGRNKISVTSPLGKALVGKTIGDTARVNAPGGVREFEIVDIFIAHVD